MGINIKSRLFIAASLAFVTWSCKNRAINSATKDAKSFDTSKNEYSLYWLAGNQQFLCRGSCGEHQPWS